MEPRKTRPSEAGPRKPYTSPNLACYGTLAELTHGGGGRKQDPSTHNFTRV